MKFSINTFAMLSAFIGVTVAAVADLGRRQTTCTAGSSVPDPVVLTVPVGRAVEISAESHAKNLQRLTVVPGHAGSTTVVFQGSGEDVPMPILTGGTGNGISIPAQTTEYQIALVFAFSTNSGSSFSVPTVRCPVVTPAGTVTISTVTSEDASDNDDNDTIATVVFD